MNKTETLVTSVRFKPSTLATITKFLQLRGQDPKSISETIRSGLEHLSWVIEQEFEETSFLNETEALNFLDQFKLLNPSQTNQKRIFGILSRESLLETLNEPTVETAITGPSQNRTRPFSSDEVKQAMQEYEKHSGRSPMVIPLDEFRRQMVCPEPVEPTEEKPE